MVRSSSALRPSVKEETVLHYVCARYGEYSEAKVVETAGSWAVCPFCGYRRPFARLSLFVISGASGAGKTTVCREIVPRLPDCVCMETDILWRPEFNTPEDGFRAYREMWLRVAYNIGQSGRPVVLFGSGEPDQWEHCVARRYFAGIHYLALVCDPSMLEARLRARPEWRGAGTDDFVERMLEYNGWLSQHARSTHPPMTLLDTSTISVHESVERTAAWIRAHLSHDLGS